MENKEKFGNQWKTWEKNEQHLLQDIPAPCKTSQSPGCRVFGDFLSILDCRSTTPVALVFRPMCNRNRNRNDRQSMFLRFAAVSSLTPHINIYQLRTRSWAREKQKRCVAHISAKHPCPKPSCKNCSSKLAGVCCAKRKILATANTLPLPKLPAAVRWSTQIATTKINKLE